MYGKFYSVNHKIIEQLYDGLTAINVSLHSTMHGVFTADQHAMKISVHAYKIITCNGCVIIIMVCVCCCTSHATYNWESWWEIQWYDFCCVD